MLAPYDGRLGALMLAVAALCCRNVHSMDMQQFSVNIYGNETHEISPLLYGIFFEEINNAGDGGLYAEMVRDRSFEALAAAQAVPTEGTLKDAGGKSCPTNFSAECHQPRLQADATAWNPWSGTSMAITSEPPVSTINRHAAHLTTKETVGGLTNGGYWGIPVQAGRQYALSMHLASPSKELEKGAENQRRWVRAALVSQDGKTTYASATAWVSSANWEIHNATLSVLENDTDAQLSISFQGPGELLIQAVSLFPAENIREGARDLWPFREDLLDMLKALQPRFLRFPGGCYVEGGDWLKDRFEWKQALGPAIDRPGHWSGNWGYWSTDGLGLFEYMLLAEELDAEPVWVINAGISHRQDIPTSQIGPWIQDALDSIEFMAGSANSTWGSKRADMGRAQPWNLTYMAIGNEDCGHPAYIGNYLAFFFAIKAHHPHIRLVANCPLGDAAPTETFDWHMYTSADDLFARRNDFNAMVPGKDPQVFASEYAVTIGAGWGNVKAAVGEAGFMTGLERKSDIVNMAAYAPLLVNTNNREWNPDMIVFDNHRVYGTPSYEVQKLFSQYQGRRFMRSDVDLKPEGPFHEWTLAASTTCQDAGCHHLALKIVNIAPHSQDVPVALHNITWGSLSAAANQTVIAGPSPQAENSFGNPDLIKAHTVDADLIVVFKNSSAAFNVTVPGTSVVLYELKIRSNVSTFGAIQQNTKQ